MHVDDVRIYQRRTGVVVLIVRIEVLESLHSLIVLVQPLFGLLAVPAVGWTFLLTDAQKLSGGAPRAEASLDAFALRGKGTERLTLRGNTLPDAHTFLFTR